MESVEEAVAQKTCLTWCNQVLSAPGSGHPAQNGGASAPITSLSSPEFVNGTAFNSLLSAFGLGTRTLSRRVSLGPTHMGEAFFTRENYTKIITTLQDVGVEAARTITADDLIVTESFRPDTRQWHQANERRNAKIVLLLEGLMKAYGYPLHCKPPGVHEIQSLVETEIAVNGIEDVRAVNWVTSFSDGVLLLVLIHKFRPDVVPSVSNIAQRPPIENVTRAFSAAKTIGAALFVDAEDLVASRLRPHLVAAQVAVILCRLRCKDGKHHDSTYGHSAPAAASLSRRTSTSEPHGNGVVRRSSTVSDALNNNSPSLAGAWDRPFKGAPALAPRGPLNTSSNAPTNVSSPVRVPSTSLERRQSLNNSPFGGGGSSGSYTSAFVRRASTTTTYSPAIAGKPFEPIILERRQSQTAVPSTPNTPAAATEGKPETATLERRLSITSEPKSARRVRANSITEAAVAASPERPAPTSPWHRDEKIAPHPSSTSTTSTIGVRRASSVSLDPKPSFPSLGLDMYARADSVDSAEPPKTRGEAVTIERRASVDAPVRSAVRRPSVTGVHSVHTEAAHRVAVAVEDGMDSSVASPIMLPVHTDSVVEECEQPIAHTTQADDSVGTPKQVPVIAVEVKSASIQRRPSSSARKVHARRDSHTESAAPMMPTDTVQTPSSKLFCADSIDTRELPPLDRLSSDEEGEDVDSHWEEEKEDRVTPLHGDDVAQDLDGAFVAATADMHMASTEAEANHVASGNDVSAVIEALDAPVEREMDDHKEDSGYHLHFGPPPVLFGALVDEIAVAVAAEKRLVENASSDNSDLPPPTFEEERLRDGTDEPHLDVNAVNVYPSSDGMQDDNKAGEATMMPSSRAEDVEQEVHADPREEKQQQQQEQQHVDAVGDGDVQDDHMAVSVLVVTHSIDGERNNNAAQEVDVDQFEADKSATRGEKLIGSQTISAGDDSHANGVAFPLPPPPPAPEELQNNSVDSDNNNDNNNSVQVEGVPADDPSHHTKTGFIAIGNDIATDDDEEEEHFEAPPPVPAIETLIPDELPPPVPEPPPEEAEEEIVVDAVHSMVHCEDGVNNTANSGVVENGDSVRVHNETENVDIVSVLRDVDVRDAESVRPPTPPPPPPQEQEVGDGVAGQPAEYSQDAGLHSVPVIAVDAESSRHSGAPGLSIDDAPPVPPAPPSPMHETHSLPLEHDVHQADGSVVEDVEQQRMSLPPPPPVDGAVDYETQEQAECPPSPPPPPPPTLEQESAVAPPTSVQGATVEETAVESTFTAPSVDVEAHVVLSDYVPAAKDQHGQRIVSFQEPTDDTTLAALIEDDARTSSAKLSRRNSSPLMTSGGEGKDKDKDKDKKSSPARKNSGFFGSLLGTFKAPFAKEKEGREVEAPSGSSNNVSSGTLSPAANSAVHAGCVSLAVHEEAIKALEAQVARLTEDLAVNETRRTIDTEQLQRHRKQVADERDKYLVELAEGMREINKERERFDTNRLALEARAMELELRARELQEKEQHMSVVMHTEGGPAGTRSEDSERIRLAKERADWDELERAVMAATRLAWDRAEREKMASDRRAWDLEQRTSLMRTGATTPTGNGPAISQDDSANRAAMTAARITWDTAERGRLTAARAKWEESERAKLRRDLKDFDMRLRQSCAREMLLAEEEEHEVIERELARFEQVEKRRVADRIARFEAEERERVKAAIADELGLENGQG